MDKLIDLFLSKKSDKISEEICVALRELQEKLKETIARCKVGLSNVESDKLQKREAKIFKEEAIKRMRGIYNRVLERMTISTENCAKRTI